MIDRVVLKTADEEETKLLERTTKAAFKLKKKLKENFNEAMAKLSDARIIDFRQQQQSSLFEHAIRFLHDLNVSIT
jgi:hypothetical protein